MEPKTPLFAAPSDTLFGLGKGTINPPSDTVTGVFFGRPDPPVAYIPEMATDGKPHADYNPRRMRMYSEPYRNQDLEDELRDNQLKLQLLKCKVEIAKCVAEMMALQKQANGELDGLVKEFENTLSFRR